MQKGNWQRHQPTTASFSIGGHGRNANVRNVYGGGRVAGATSASNLLALMMTGLNYQDEVVCFLH